MRNNEHATRGSLAPPSSGGFSLSPPKTRRHRPYGWIAAAGAAVVVGFLAVCGWLYWIQVCNHEKLGALAKANRNHRTLLQPLRGAVTDIQGSVLAASVPVKTVCGNPSLMNGRQREVARVLAPLLEMKEGDLAASLQPRIYTNSRGALATNAHIVIKRKVPMERWLEIKRRMAKITLETTRQKPTWRERQALRALRQKAVFALDDQLREYPGRKLAAHVIGFASSEDRLRDGGRMYEMHGLDGIELVCDKELSGVPGWRGVNEEVAPRRGLTVVLTLDAGIQNILESEIDQAAEKHTPASISAAVIRPGTGEVLALVNWPAFDPNQYGSYPAASLRNRVITDPVEPGSTFKVVSILAALHAGVVALDSPIDCGSGSYVVAGRVLHDHAAYKTLTVAGVIQKSSNIGAAKIAALLGPERLHQCITNFGFNDLTGIPLPGESRGVLRPVAKWDKLSITRIPMGHEILVTPIQIAYAVAAIGNNGRLMRPMLVDRFEDEQGRVARKFYPQVVRQVVHPASARCMVEAMKLVAAPGGTAPKAQLDHYTVAAKTGTAQKFINGTYNSGRYCVTFGGFLPADAPEVCVALVIDDPDPRKGYYAGEVAGPIFKAIAGRVAAYLCIPPEPPTEPQIKPGPSTEPDLAGTGAYALQRRPRAAASTAGKGFAD